MKDRPGPAEGTLELDQIRAFVFAVEEGSVQGAALRLHRSQPAVSRLIRSLEYALGESLLDRSTRPASPTEFGREVLDEARRALDAVDRLEGRGRTDAGAKRTTIRLGVSHAYTRIVASPLVSMALSASGNPALRIHTGWSIPLLKELQESRLDAALMGFPGRWSPPADLRSEPVREEELVVIAPRDARIRGITRLRDLAPHPWILNSEGCGLRARLQAEFAEAGRSLNLHVELRGSLSQHIEFVAAGFGFGLVPLCALSIHPQRREVRRVPLKETLATSLWVLWRASDRAAEARWAGIRAALVRSATARAL